VNLNLVINCVNSVGREEIKKIEEDHRDQKSKGVRMAHVAGNIRSTAQSTGGGTGRPGCRPVCTTCMAKEWSTGPVDRGSDQSIARSTD